MTKLNSEIINEMSKLAADGIPVCYICDYVGIHETTYHEWMKIGEQDDLDDNQTLYATLWRSIKKSCAQFVIDSTARIKQGTPGWQGTAWILERTHTKYMPKQQITPDEDGKVNVIIGGKVKDIKKQ